MKTLFSIASIILFLIAGSCSLEDNDTYDEKTIELDEKSAQLIEADNTFGFDIFQKIRKESEQDNIMISPLSISVALAMAYNGAASDTKTEMENVLQLNGLTTEQINDSYKMLIAALQSLDEDVVFEIANAIFYEESFLVKSDFINANKSYYNAEVEKLNFRSSSALQTINDWVADKTHDKITKILDSLSPDDQMVLLNAIYFRGTWTTEFDEEGTKIQNFWKEDGTSSEVAMMSKEDQLKYISNDLFTAVKIPYGSGQYNMTILLPNEGKNSQNIIDELSSENWENWSVNFKTQNNVLVTMPRFKFEFKQGLIPVLKQMGMLKAFSSQQADFSNITDMDLYISDVCHKTYIDVNETGTEAAAVTSITFTTTSVVAEPEKIYFTVDKPFVFSITEEDTNAVLFIGQVQNPEYKE
jgi:serpin B